MSHPVPFSGQDLFHKEHVMNKDRVIQAIETTVAEIESELEQLAEKKAKLSDDLRRHKKMLAIAKHTDQEPVADAVA